MASGACLLVFTKNPILGTAKTRIGKVKGDEVALNVYKELLRYTRAVVVDLKCKKVVYFNKFIEQGGIWESDFIKRLQVDGDLGTKMSSAFKEELSKSSSVILIGSDCLEISTRDIEKAFEELKKNDVVIGPAEDGGYYLLGMNDFQSYLFEDMPWSEDNLMEETKRKVEQLGLRLYELPMKSDVDYWEDWEKMGWPLT